MTTSISASDDDDARPIGTPAARSAVMSPARPGVGAAQARSRGRYRSWYKRCKAAASRSRPECAATTLSTSARLTPARSASSAGSACPPCSPMISAMIRIESGSESMTTPSMSKITPRRRGAGAGLTTCVIAQRGPPESGRLPEVFQDLLIVLLERRDDLQDERDVRRTGPAQCRQHLCWLDDAGGVRLGRGRQMVGRPAVRLLGLHD